jgi:hypothetical protein
MASDAAVVKRCRMNTAGPDNMPDDANEESRPPLPMEFGSMPLDPIYAWSIVLEPVETLINCTASFIEQLARETYDRGEGFDDEELERRFLAYFDGLVKDGTLARLPDAEPAMGRRILGPRRWLRAQRIRINRLVAFWQEQGDPGPKPAAHP